MRFERVIFFGLLAITVLALLASGFFEQFMRGYDSVLNPGRNLKDLVLYTAIFLAWYVFISILYYSLYRIHRIWRLKRLARQHGTGESAMKLEPAEKEAEEELEKIEQS